MASCERREQARIRQRIPCELDTGEQALKGVVLDLSAASLFVQLSTALLPPEGASVSLRLFPEPPASEVEVSGRVVRRQLAPRGCSHLVAQGIAIRIDDAALEYREMLSRTLGSQVEIEVVLELGDSADPDPAEVEEDELPARRDPGFPGDHAELPVSAEAGAAEPADEVGLHPECPPADLPEDPPPSSPAVEPARETRAPVSVPTPINLERARRMRRIPTALIVCAGSELDDVYGAIERIGGKPVRAPLDGPTCFRGWVHPPRALVVEAQAALAVEIPEDARASGVVCIAVADSHSRVLGSLLGRLGYDFLVRRPVHPDALDLLLRRALYRGTEARAADRIPLGIAARLQAGLWRYPCTLLDLSSNGCRVATTAPIDMLADVTLRIARATTGRRRLALRARVVRRLERAGGETVLALRFAEVSESQSQQIAGVLERRSLGPTAPPGRDLLRFVREAVARRCLKAGQARSLDEAVPETQATPVDRRSNPRVKIAREVVAVDSGAVDRVLVGRDLSLGGMRVEPHPGLCVGDRLTLGIHGVGKGEPMLLGAVVDRDDGPAGLALRFEEPDAEVAGALAQVMSSVPLVEALEPDPVLPSRVVFARIRTRKARAS